jgi:hypothetical protein
VLFLHQLQYMNDLMDAAYNAKEIWEQSRELGHVPIIDRNLRRGDAIPIAPHEARWYS